LEERLLKFAEEARAAAGRQVRAWEGPLLQKARKAEAVAGQPAEGVILSWNKVQATVLMRRFLRNCFD
jgi:hypothetical protein